MANSIPRRSASTSIPRRNIYAPESEADAGAEDFYIDYSNLDPIQQEIINRKNDSHLVVSGTAGSGKSLLALHKAKQLAQESYAIIVYTKTLRRYFATGLKSLGLTNVYHWDDWKKETNKPHVKYLIVDECQDFFKDEIEELIQYGDYCLFFGDTSQSIMGMRRPKENILHGLQSVEDTAKTLKCEVDWLCFNYRLTKENADVVLKIGEPKLLNPTPFTGEVSDYKINDKKYILRNVPYVPSNGGNGILMGDYYIGRKNSDLYNPVVFVRHGEPPKFINESSSTNHLSAESNFNAQLDKIVDIIRNNQLTNVAILLPFNYKESAESYRAMINHSKIELPNPIDYLSVEYVQMYLKEKKGIPCEYQYNKTKYDQMNINFRTSTPKIMTYWVAKGLQFNDVFIPGCENKIMTMQDKPQAVSVAMSRSKERLYICYSGSLCEIFGHNYKPEYSPVLDDNDLDF